MKAHISQARITMANSLQPILPCPAEMTEEPIGSTWIGSLAAGLRGVARLARRLDRPFTVTPSQSVGTVTGRSERWKLACAVWFTLHGG